MSEQQLPLFDDPDGAPPGGGDDHAGEALHPGTPLSKAVLVYEEALRLRGSSEHTIRSFRSDLRLLGRHTGHEKPVGTYATEDLNDFLHWLLHDRGVPCSPKSYARRVTTLKHFFGYLYEQQAIPGNPADAVIQQPATSPLPSILFEGEIARVLEVTQNMRTDPDKPDARPHLLVTLLLQTGIKKGECMALQRGDVDRSSPNEPVLWVRYTNPRLRYKERKIRLASEWPFVLNEYLAQYQPPDVIFDCTARNLEYVLANVANVATVPRKKMSFETLRWTCAVQDYLAGMDSEQLRQKLGLSRVGWRESYPKIERLAESAV